MGLNGLGRAGILGLIGVGGWVLSRYLLDLLSGASWCFGGFPVAVLFGVYVHGALLQFRSGASFDLDGYGCG